MLDPIPFARARRQMTHQRFEGCFIHKRLQLIFPKATAISVAAAAVRANQKTLGSRVLFLPHGLPPAADAGHRETGRVMIASHIHPSFVAGPIINAIGNRLGFLRVNKIVNLHLLRTASRPPLAAFIGIAPNEFFLLGVDGDHGVALPQEPLNLAVQVTELSISVSNRPTVSGLIGFPSWERVSASWGVLWHVHNSGDMGSPRVLDSTNSFSRFRIRGLCSTICFRPPPGTLTRSPMDIDLGFLISSNAR